MASPPDLVRATLHRQGWRPTSPDAQAWRQLRVVRFMPDPIPAGRTYIVDAHAECVEVHGGREGRYGEALRDAYRAGGGFLSLEWDIAVDRDDLQAMAIAVRETGGDQVCAAPVRIYEASMVDAGQMAGTAVEDVVQPHCLWDATEIPWPGPELAAALARRGLSERLQERLEAVRALDAAGQYEFTGIAEGQAECDVFGFGCTWLPARLLEAADQDGLLDRLRYPHADRRFALWCRARGERARVVWDSHPKHLHDRSTFTPLQPPRPAREMRYAIVIGRTPDAAGAA